MSRGQTSVQLNIVRHRQTPDLELRICNRCSPPWSRLSKINRCALTIAAGPTYCSLVQVIGQDDVQHAQRMHLVVSSNRARCSGDCRRSSCSLSSSAIRYGLIDLYESKNWVMSTTISLITRKPINGSMVIFLP